MTEHMGIFTNPGIGKYLGAEPELHAKQLSQRLWTVSDGLCRTLFIEANNSVVAFDTFGTPGKARAYRRVIEQAVPGKPIATLIYTHDHLDHAGFGADLAPDAEILADEMTARVVDLRGADGQLAVSRTFSGQQNPVTLDGTEFVLLNPGPTHGTGNLSAYFADERLLFSSDTILPNARYALMPDYHIANFVRFMRGFLERDFETFVPGRFEVTDRARFERGCDYIEAVQEACQQAFVELVPIWVMDVLAEYVTAKLGQRFGDLDGFEQHVGMTSIRIVHHYLMGGYGLEDTPSPGYVLAD